VINRSESELIARERRNQALRQPEGGRIAENHPFERASPRKAQRPASRSSAPETASPGESRPVTLKRRGVQK
jgi:hypothetical protein